MTVVDTGISDQMVGRFAATPPVSGVGPGVLDDPSPFLEQLFEAGLDRSADRFHTTGSNPARTHLNPHIVRHSIARFLKSKGFKVFHS